MNGQDGMDLSLIIMDKQDNTLQFSGAYNPLLMLRKLSVNEKTKLKNGNELDFSKGSLYMFSDGFVDQFGGPDGKKFMSRRFKKLILDIQDKSMEEQGEILNKILIEWTGELDQVDDILVVGIKIE